MNLISKIAYFSFAIAFTIGCNNGPKVITSENTSENSEMNSGIFSELTNNVLDESISNQTSMTESFHKVVIKKSLPTSRYLYLNVTEDNKEFWIATRTKDVILGNTYFYRGGLLKTNFESKEYNRVFDTIYLVSNLVAESHGNNAGDLTANFSEMNTKTQTLTEKKDIPTHTEDIIQHKGSIKIADLVANSAAYEGKTVQLTGKCVKINPNIMNLNWIHLKDGSKDDYDLVITSNTFVPEGKVITIKAQVSLNRDFGAGYQYDLILENGIIIE